MKILLFISIFPSAREYVQVVNIPRPRDICCLDPLQITYIPRSQYSRYITYPIYIYIYIYSILSLECSYSTGITIASYVNERVLEGYSRMPKKAADKKFQIKNNLAPRAPAIKASENSDPNSD